MKEIVTIYSDGGLVRSNPSPHGGTWAWCAVDAQDRLVTGASGLYIACGQPGCQAPDHWPQPAVTNNGMEFVALVLGLEAMPPGWSGLVCSDSLNALSRLFLGARLSNLPPVWVQRGGQALQRVGACTWELLDGHPTRAQLTAGVGKRGRRVSRWNVHCDQRCTAEAAAAVRQHAPLAWPWGCAS